MGRYVAFSERVLYSVANGEGVALTVGARIGAYEMTSRLGEGGMGVVFRARDTKLGRDVAFKVLPVKFATDSERIARFRREAHVLAALNHPNIASIYGLEESGGATALVLELVEGPTLADRLRSGPIPPDEALSIAKQVAEALEAAHEKSIVHRDLKPANIKVTPDGKVKVLDFGLAKIFDDETPNPNLSESPTMLSPESAPGLIVGTVAYMSPEQARGKTVDRRTDIWAFGAVLFELLTGHPAFAGETMTDILGAVVHKEPDWEKLPAESPAALVRVLKRCLVKDARQRLHDIADARIEMESGALEFVHESEQSRGRAVQAKKQWALFVTTLVLSLAAGAAAMHWLDYRAGSTSTSKQGSGPTTHTVVDLPAGLLLSRYRKQALQDLTAQSWRSRRMELMSPTSVNRAQVRCCTCGLSRRWK